MKKSLRENTDVRLMAIILFFLIAVVAGMWLYQVKVLQKNLPQSRPVAAAPGEPGIQSLTLHGELSQVGAPGKQDSNGEPPDKPGLGNMAGNRTMTRDTNLSKYIPANYFTAPAADISHNGVLSQLKVNVQPACHCVDESLSSVKSIVQGL